MDILHEPSLMDTYIGSKYIVNINCAVMYTVVHKRMSIFKGHLTWKIDLCL